MATAADPDAVSQPADPDAVSQPAATAELPWRVIDALFNHGGGPEAAHVLVQHQIGSFNEFVDKKIGQVINGFNPIQICHQFREDIQDFVHKIAIRIVNPTLSKPYFTAQDGAQVLMTPHFARMNNLTYAASLLVDVNILTETINEDGVIEKKEASVNGVCIGRLPIMVRSKICALVQMPGIAEGGGKHECRYDLGGYFIVNGNEKVVISQDRISENKTVVFAPNSGADGLTAEIRSVPDGVFMPPKTCALHLSSKPNAFGRVIRLACTFLKSEVPLFVMFRALGVESDEAIVRHILLDPSNPRLGGLASELAACADDGADVRTQAQALASLQRIMGMSGTPREFLDNPAVVSKVLFNFIENDFLPHVGPSLARKAVYLGYMVRKLLRVSLGYEPYDNRDSYANKRIDTPGVLVGNLFRQCYGKLIKEMRNLIQRELHLWRNNTLSPYNIINPTNVHRFLKQTVIESGLRYSLSTGNWGVKSIGGFQNIRQGVAQVLNRMSYLSTLSHLRRINTPMEKNGKLVQPRKLDNSQFGMICFAETPEGGAVGLVKNMAFSTVVTTAATAAYLRACLPELGVRVLEGAVSDPDFLRAMGRDDVVHVVVNGDIVGYHADPVAFYAAMKHKKRAGEVSPYASVAWDVQRRTISVSTEAGRMCRPLFVVGADGGLPAAAGGAAVGATTAFASLVAPLDGREGVVEFLDVEEVDRAMIAMSPAEAARAARDKHTVGLAFALPPRYTHCEIHPSMTLGVLGINIPFSEHNQAPRVAYQCAMGKQAVGVYMSNFNARIDTMSHVLHYGQKPLARTRLAKHTFSDALPSGVNAVVAIMTYTGFNQEDSVMLNQSALDRGMFATTYYKSYKDQCNKNHSTGEEEVFARPEADATSHLKPFNYGKLGADGFVPNNTAVDADDVLVGKVMPLKIQGEIQPRDASLFMKGGDEGVVDHSYVGTNADGYRFCKVRLRKYRKPTVGDKFSSRHAQKGSCGMVYRQQDMPFTKDGIVPDIIINPHAIPSRMTVGQLMECVMGKAGCCLGALGDATPFSACSVGALGAVLEANGMERYGNEILYDGRSGGQIQTEIFIGPTFYQRLKHMVVDKMHCLTMDHEVLTRGGWRFFEELAPEDEVASLVDGCSEFVRPTALHRYPSFEGDVFDVRSEALDLTVTAEHRMWVSPGGGEPFRLVLADALVGRTAWYETGGGKVVAHTLREADRRVHRGAVFCVSVPSEVFLVRRNGKAVWTGNSRGSNGPVVFLTRQPAEGRARNGGLRFGEMERDAIVAHGASAFLKERMLDVSDNYRVFVCRKCGVMCVANPERRIFRCTHCKCNADITQARIPYSMKLLVQELMTLGVGPRFVL